MRQDETGRNGFRSAPISRAKSANALLSDERFRSVLWRESKRSERSQKHLLLTLIDHGVPCEQPYRCRSLVQAAGALGSTIRETDIVGWFDANCVLGVIFTEFGLSDVTLATQAIRTKITKSLQRAFIAQQSLHKFHLSFYAFPDHWLEYGRATAATSRQVTEPKASVNELLVDNPVVMRWASRLAELCSPSQRFRLD
jgi:hypothetical protein